MMMRNRLILGLLVLTALRWVVGWATELTAGEALVWVGGRQAWLGHFGYGPVAGWLVRAGVWVAGDTSMGVRWWAPVAVLVASWAGWRLVASAFGDKAGGWFLIGMQLMPAVNLASVRAVPETAMMGCAAVGAWWLWQGLHRASAWAWQWPAAGLAFGLAGMAAPSGIGLVVGVVVLLVIPRRWRGRWRSPGPWLALTAAAAALVPWGWWLHARDWLPLTSGWFGWGRQMDFWAVVRWVGLTVLAASPLLWAGMVWAGARAVAAAGLSWRRYRVGGLSVDDPWDQKNGRVFLLGLAGPSALVMVAGVVGGLDGLGATAIVGGAALMLLAAAWVESPLPPTPHRLAQNASLLVAGAYSLLALNSDVSRHLGLPWPYRADPTVGGRGWRELADQTSAAHKALMDQDDRGRPVFLIAETPALAAVVEFYLARTDGLPAAEATRLRCHVPARLVVDNDYSFWPGYADEPSWRGLDALFVADAPSPETFAVLGRQFDRLESLGRIEIRRGRWPVRSVEFFACRSWRGPAR